MSLYSSLTQVLAPFAAKINGLLTGWDGTKYSTPGEAVRTQISDLHVLIGDVPGQAIDSSAISYGDSNVETALDTVNGRLTELDDALNEVVTPVLAWERGNLKPDGTNAGSGRYVRTINPVIIDSDTFHVEFDDSYSTDAIIGIRIYNGDTVVESINKRESADIPITPGYGVRFLLTCGGNDTETVIPVESADDYLTITYDHVMNVHTDKTLSLSNRPADAKIVGQRIADIVNVQRDIPLVWERGDVSSTGNNTSSGSLVVIRTKLPAIHAEYPTIYYSVDSGYKMTVWKNDDGTQSVTSKLTGDGSFTFGGEGVFRLTLRHTDDSEIDPSDGSHVRIYGIEDLKTTVNDLTERVDKSDYESFMSFSIFQKFGVIGDSFASGSLHHPDDGGWTGNYDMSWPQILARQTGSQAVNFTKGGLSTKTWLENTTWGLAKLLATEAQQLYIIALGINDSTQIGAGTLSLGTIADVDTEDYTQNPNTFYGNYGRIIGNILAHAPYAKIACLSVARLNERGMDTHIKAIADKYGLPFIDLTSDPYFTSTVYYGSIISNHPLTYGYAGMAKAIERLICLDVIENPYWDTYYGLTAEDESGEPDE
jgi:lysophospholipase L1-like esterase